MDVEPRFSAFSLFLELASKYEGKSSCGGVVFQCCSLRPSAASLLYFCTSVTFFIFLEELSSAAAVSLPCIWKSQICFCTAVISTSSWLKEGGRRACKPFPSGPALIRCGMAVSPSHCCSQPGPLGGIREDERENPARHRKLRCAYLRICFAKQFYNSSAHTFMNFGVHWSFIKMHFNCFSSSR